MSLSVNAFAEHHLHFAHVLDKRLHEIGYKFRVSIIRPLCLVLEHVCCRSGGNAHLRKNIDRIAIVEFEQRERGDLKFDLRQVSCVHAAQIVDAIITRFSDCSFGHLQSASKKGDQDNCRYPKASDPLQFTRIGRQLPAFLPRFSAFSAGPLGNRDARRRPNCHQPTYRLQPGRGAAVLLSELEELSTKIPEVHPTRPPQSAANSPCLRAVRHPAHLTTPTAEGAAQ